MLGACAKDSSTWFSGYHDKYFYDWGATVACAFPKGKHFIKWYFALKFRKKTGVPVRSIFRQMNRGIRGYQKLQPYSQEEKYV